MNRHQTRPALLLPYLLLVLAACAAEDAPNPSFDGGPGFDATHFDARVSQTALDQQCAQFSDVRVSSCGAEYASGYCSLGAFIESTPCEAEVAAFFQCGIDSPGPALCDEESPCAFRQQAAYVCLRAHCDVDPYLPGCISLYGCQADCTGKVCGDDDRCGGTCTYCASGRCDESAGMCATGGVVGNYDADCDCGSFSVDTAEPAIICRDTCTGDTQCLEQLLADEGRCAVLCDPSDNARQGSCPSGWTCYESFYEDVSSGAPIAECIQN